MLSYISISILMVWLSDFNVMSDVGHCTVTRNSASGVCMQVAMKLEAVTRMPLTATSGPTSSQRTAASNMSRNLKHGMRPGSGVRTTLLILSRYIYVITVLCSGTFS